MDTQLPDVSIVDDRAIGAPTSEAKVEAEPRDRVVHARWEPSWRLMATAFPLLCVDAGAIVVSILVAAFATREIGMSLSFGPLATGVDLELWIALGLAVFVNVSAGLYPGTGVHPARELRKLVICVGGTLAILALLQMAAARNPLPAIGLWILMSAVMGLPLVLGSRAVARHFLAKRDWWGERVVVIGTSDQAAAVVRSIFRNPRLGLRPQLAVAGGAVGIPGDYLAVGPRLGELVQRSGARVAILYAPDFLGQENAAILNECASYVPRMIVIPDIATSLPAIDRGPWQFCSWPTLEIRQPLLSSTSRIVKRALDIAVVVATAPLTVPAMLFLAAVIKLTTPGPAFFKHRRIGKGGRIFHMWKFRTMVVNSEEVLNDCLAKDEALRREWESKHKLADDPRVTWVGRWLRKTSLDELPQLGNVLCGQMSLVGPRPIVVSKEGKRYLVEHPESYNEYRKVSPGITGLWQVLGRNQTTFEDRVNLEAYYVRNWSLWLDLYILARTGMVVVRGTGAY